MGNHEYRYIHVSGEKLMTLYNISYNLYLLNMFLKIMIYVFTLLNKVIKL